MDTQAQMIQKGDCIELKFTGYVDGRVFDSNIETDLKVVHEKAAPEKTLVIVGQHMVVNGLDKALEGKELHKEYHIALTAKEGFGIRRTELVKTLPLKVFAGQRVPPRPGAAFIFDNQLARVIAVSGARVITDFNNPLAGKDIEYKFIITHIVTDIREKAEAVCKLLLHFIPEIEVNGQTVILKGPKFLEQFIRHQQPRFKEFLGTEVQFKEVEKPQEASTP